MNDYKRQNSWSLLEQALKEATEIKTPELTIDLPHNQKLTIGQLKPDTIVEIATWKGSGAPDENSVRMLIGASLQNGSEIAAENEAAAAAVVAEAVADVVEAVSPSKPEEITSVSNQGFSTPNLGGPSTPNAWEMVQKLEAERTRASQTEFQKELGRKELRKMAEKKSPKFKLFTALGSFAAMVLIVAGLNVGGFLAFDHPQVGPELPFGPATNSLVAIVPNTPANIGEFAMATIDGKRNLVRVDGVGADSYTVSTMAGSQVITGEQLDGKISFLIPFVGFFWTIVGQ